MIVKIGSGSAKEGCVTIRSGEEFYKAGRFHPSDNRISIEVDEAPKFAMLSLSIAEARAIAAALDVAADATEDGEDL